MKNFGINLVGTLIPKFQLPWRTLLVNRYNAIDRFRDEKVIPVVKKIAHYINEHGLQEAEKVVSSGARRAIFDLAMMAWNNNDKRGKTHSEHMRNYTQDAINRKKANMPSRTNSLVAAASSLAGTGVSFLGPIGTTVGTIMGIPDLVYDWAASIDEPENLRNHAHTATNYAELLAKIVPGKLDDYVAKTGNFVSNLDDAFSAIGSDMYESKLIARK